MTGSHAHRQGRGIHKEMENNRKAKRVTAIALLIIFNLKYLEAAV